MHRLLVALWRFGESSTCFARLKRELCWPVPFTLQVVALHAAATNHWSRGVRERAYTVASRLTLVCGIPVGPDEEDEEAENSGEAASPFCAAQCWRTVCAVCVLFCRVSDGLLRRHVHVACLTDACVSDCGECAITRYLSFCFCLGDVLLSPQVPTHPPGPSCWPALLPP